MYLNMERKHERKKSKFKTNENLYVTTYENGEVEYMPSTPEDNEKEEKKIKKSWSEIHYRDKK